ncbi:DUF309 domain-containing protein [Euzebya tangerina]|uniref:DUF309 domain-containing protein n=1 Tax=Euzebya tangerina TaxID=591198 RepID=UPI000E319512|nr:DUF309 domain-containing protein [Euzebya tangerina]
MTDQSESDVVRLARDRNDDGKPENARPRDRFGAPLPRDAEDQLPDRVEPEDVVDTVEDTLACAIALFDEERFFEAHEFFEWAWKGPMTPDDQRQLFKGLAQICVGYCHIQRGNATGAASLLERGIEHIEPYGENAQGIDLVAVGEDAQRMVGTLQQLAAQEGEARDPKLRELVTFPQFHTAS